MRLPRILLFASAILGLLGLFNSPVQSEIRAESNFSVRNGGQVAVDGRSFGTIREYFLSDYFKTTGKRCGTTLPEHSESEAQLLFRSPSDCTLAATVIQDEYSPEVILTIPVVVHIIHKLDGTGNLEDDRINRQIRVLNEDYAAMAHTLGENGFNTRIQFKLEKITRTANDYWFGDNDEIGYKSTLGWDQSRYCNIYVNSASGYLGYAYFPAGNPGVRDGLVILYEAFGGRNEGTAPYNQGRTVAHEMGHYLGLYHTFEGYNACSNTYTTGDLILDTPAESEAHFECMQTYTCSSIDAIHNYMNYTPDACMDQFTREQANRMVCSLLNYRPNLVTMTLSPSIISPLLLLLND